MSAISSENITIDKGSTFEETFYFSVDDNSELNLNDVTVIAKLKKHPLSAISYEFTTSVMATQGAITLKMDPEITSTLPSGRCVYDIIIEDAMLKRKKLVEGNVIVKDSVSV